MGGRIPRSFIRELLDRVDIVDVIQDHVPLRKAGRDYTARCPFHEERTPSFTVSPAKQFFHCFGCGAHGNAIDFLMRHQRLEFPEAVEQLAARAGLEVPREGGRAPRRDAGLEALRDLLEEVSAHYRRQLREHPAAPRAVAYLRGRGLDGAVAARFGLGYAPPGWDGLLRAFAGREALLVRAGLVVEREDGRRHDRFRDRIMFPIRDVRGRVVGFGGRALGEATPKYLNSPETPLFHKGRLLYGLHEALAAEARPPRLLVVEGYMDVIALAQAGLPWAVATLGTATTAEHLAALFRHTREVVFCFDGDAAGRRAAWHALETALPFLEGDREVRFLVLPAGEDPDTLVRREGRERFEARVVHATPLSRHLLDGLARGLDLAAIEGRARLAAAARPLLRRIPPGFYRDLLAAELARRTGLALEDEEAAPAPPRPRGIADPRRRPVRLAIALLLEQPALARDAPDPAPWRALDLPGIGLLCELVELLRADPHLTTGAVLEHFRGREEAEILARIAAWEHGVPAAGARAELEAVLARLEAQARSARQRLLTERYERGEATPAEVAELRALLTGAGRRDETS
ncbi:DNA primase [Inmirania thermothiophila]|uniref:DNA primase n=1 Tax=Inmirania thermothiophila TaxID=1750597 RepID=A0A3N1Y5U7_9GAMM|nr:DNA primase [Inmirania thermothiophila]ROR34184.1 DNA primase [Inmirania thermothiophila]